MYGYKVWLNGLNIPRHVLFLWNKLSKYNLELWYVGQKLSL
jgi:hypothetical protein